MTESTAMCVECEKHPAWSRGLCNTCYSTARRGGFLGDYPTQKFLDDPESHARWLFALYPQMLGDIAVEYNLRLVEG